MARKEFPEARLRETRHAGEEADFAREALDAGATTIVALGGDGTWSTVAGVLATERADCTLALLAAGTANDFAKNAGAPAGDPALTARLVAAGTTRLIDIGVVGERCFVNSVGFGFDAAVAAAAGRRRWPGGGAHYLAWALEQLFIYRGVEIVHAGSASERCLLLVVANGERFGGMFRIAPDASISDGELDMIAISDAAPVGRLQLLLAAIDGRHISFPTVSRRRGTTFTLVFRDPPAFEADGEICRARTNELVVRCAPGALRVVSAAGASV